MPHSSGEVARMLGIGISTLSRYITAGKIPTPNSVTAGGITVYLWAEKGYRARPQTPAQDQKWQKNEVSEKEATKSQ